MNDPNGLVFADGVYHLFYQYHPDGLTWGPMHWGHATSRDLLHWEEHPIALFPDALGMVFSGSIVIDTDNTSGLGRDGKAPWVAIFTHHDPVAERTGGNVHQYQSIAFSLDDGASWSKFAGNPVLPNPGIKNFRDPKVFWHDDTRRWIMSLAAGDHIQFYSSPDLKLWTLESELGGFGIADGNVLECPDLVAMDLEGRKRWILIVSVVTGAPNGGSGTRYVVGDFDGSRFTPEHDDIRWLDYGPDNYAGVTFHNTGGRVLLIGWMSNWAYAQAVPTAPWRSAMTLPRELSLANVDGQTLLCQRVAADLGGGAVALNDACDLSGFSGHLNIANPDGAGFIATFSNAVGDELLIGFDPAAREYYVDRRRAGIAAFSPQFPIRATAPARCMNGAMELYLDRSSVELFADSGLTVMTSLLFPRGPYARVTLSRR